MVIVLIRVLYKTDVAEKISAIETVSLENDEVMEDENLDQNRQIGINDTEREIINPVNDEGNVLAKQVKN